MRIIAGNYYESQETISVHVQVINTKTNEVEITLPIVKNNKARIEELVNEISQRIMTIYDVDKSLYGKRYINNAPKYDAYKEHEKGLEYFLSNKKQSEHHFLNAIALDSTFFSPYCS